MEGSLAITHISYGLENGVAAVGFRCVYNFSSDSRTLISLEAATRQNDFRLAQIISASRSKLSKLSFGTLELGKLLHKTPINALPNVECESRNVQFVV